MLWPPLVPTTVLVESLNGDAGRDANTNRFLKTCIIESTASVDVAAGSPNQDARSSPVTEPTSRRLPLTPIASARDGFRLFLEPPRRRTIDVMAQSNGTRTDDARSPTAVRRSSVGHARSSWAAIAVVLTFGAAACGSGGSPGGAPPVESSAPSVVETPTTDGAETIETTSGTVPTETTQTTLPPETTIAASVGWAQAAADDGVFDGEPRQSINAVTVGGPGFVAVGFVDTEVDQTLGSTASIAGAVWTSPDGLEWTRSPDEAGVFSGEGGRELNAVAAGGPGLVALGQDVIGAAVWTSPDGLAWTRVPDATGVLGGSQDLNGFVAAGGQLVAVGSSYDNDGPGLSATVWTSPDGTNWARQFIPQYDPAEVHASMNAVIEGGPGLIAVGFVSTGDDEDAAVWTSPDGVTWTRVPHDEAVFGGSGYQSMNAVTVGGPGLVAVGQDSSGDGVGAAVWTSPDGVAWTKVPGNPDTFGGSDARIMLGVAADGSRLVAVGAIGTGSAIWTSPDGAMWTWETQDQEAFDNDGGVVHDITVGDSRLVAVGQERRSAMVWVTDRSS